MNLDEIDEVDELPARPREDIPAADRELLELAARAIGAVRVEDVDGEQWVILHFADGTEAHGWNPLLFYADTFELACDCGIDLHHGCDFARANAIGVAEEEEAFERGSKEAGRAATARAVVRAAAEIGKTMP